MQRQIFNDKLCQYDISGASDGRGKDRAFDDRVSPPFFSCRGGLFSAPAVAGSISHRGREARTRMFSPPRRANIRKGCIHEWQPTWDLAMDVLVVGHATSDSQSDFDKKEEFVSYDPCQLRGEHQHYFKVRDLQGTRDGIF